MNVMILGGKPPETATAACASGSELLARIGRIEACLDRLEQALALADRALDGKVPQPCKTSAPATRAKTPPASPSTGKGGAKRGKTDKTGTAGTSSATA